MASIINASTSGVGGVITTADNSGDLNIQSGGSTKIAVTSAGVAVTGLSKGSLPTGSVLQVVNVNNYTSYSTSSSTYISIGLSATITPTSATSKILMLCSLASVGKSTNDTYAAFRYHRNGSMIQDLLGVYGGWTSSTARSVNAGTSFQYLDSPATTSATTYEVLMNSDANLATVQTTHFKSMTLLEIAA
jgi:hypothetical protein